MEVVKRGFAMLLICVLCLGMLLDGDVRATDVDTGIVKNWGFRGTYATYLSDSTVAFYQENGMSYELLSTLSGAENVEDVPQSQLYDALKELMTTNHSVITSYAQTTDLYRYTDCIGGDDGSISSFYSGLTIGPEWDSGATWNREHTWPNSKGLDGDDENDIMMLRPTGASENSSRGNKAYGESSGFFDPNTVSAGVYDLRGDVARIALYVYVRWGNTEHMWGSDGMIESMELLLRWIEEDPVDTWELGRNDSVESITGTRNVFVDYPELAFVLFCQEIPAGMTTPSGEAAKGEYSVTAYSSNDACGSVRVSGNAINAVPTEGYRADGFTVESGTAEVIREGNTFYVTASSDCVVTIHFVKRDSVSVTFSENGAEVSSQSVYSGDTVQLPRQTNPVSSDYSFQGWVTEPVAETSNLPSVIYAAGSSCSVSEDTVLYALYSRVDTRAGAARDLFELYTGDVTEGDYLITYDGGALQAAAGSGGRLAYLDVSVTNDAVQKPDAELIWHISFTEDGYTVLYNAQNDVYAAGSGSKNKASLLSEVTDYAKWTISGDQTYDIENLGNINKGVNYTLRRNTTFGFACYAAVTGGRLTLYKAVAGTVYYSTTTQTCAHANAAEISGAAPSCTEAGYTAGVYCADCTSYVNGHEVIAASGHSYATVVTPPTVTQQGYTTYSCTACGDSYVSGYTEPSGELRTISYVVPEGVTQIPDMQCGNSGIVLPVAEVPTGELDYTFAGWATEPVDNSTAEPVLYLPGSNYTTAQDQILYAVYSCFVGQAGSGRWFLVTDETSLSSGDQLVIASAEKGYAAGRISSQYMTHVQAEFSDDMTQLLELPSDAVVLTLGGGEGAWTLSDTDGQLLGATAVKKLAWDKGTTTWSITVLEGSAVITNESADFGSFRYNVNSPRFTTYTSAVTSSILLPELYRKDTGEGTTYYTSVLTAICRHGGAAELRGQVDACFDADGYTGDFYCGVCGELLETGSVIPRNPFTDVNADRFENFIVWAYYQGITSGTTRTTFSPEQYCTREQIVMMLWRMAECPEPASWENPFTDVEHDNFEQAILWAYYSGITYGTTKTTFCPDSPCTREQMMTFLWRVGGSAEPSSIENPFEDVPQDRFEKAILWAYHSGITYGTTDNTFSPDEYCTRKQVVTFLYRLFFKVTE